MSIPVRTDFCTRIRLQTNLPADDSFATFDFVVGAVENRNVKAVSPADIVKKIVQLISRLGCSLVGFDTAISVIVWENQWIVKWMVNGRACNVISVILCFCKRFNERID